MAKRETIGKRLNTARLNLGLSVPQLVQKISEDHRFPIGASTIRDIEADKTPNPGFKTLEFIALGVGLDPLEVIGLGLDDPPELEPGYTESQLAQLWRVYKTVNKNYRSVADELVKMLIEKMERWR
jgi:transcriptional regulator with XRE-family HTH domain